MAKPGLRITKLDNKTNKCYSKMIKIPKEYQSSNDTYSVSHILSFNI